MTTLKQIQYFLTVANLGSLSQAAKILYVAQPALSRQISLLEAELGFSLFVREPRGVSLTAGGERYRDRILSVPYTLSQAADEALHVARGESGVLRLLHSSTIPVSSLMSVFQTFLKKYPSTRIDLDRSASEFQVTEVAEGKADVGMIRLPVLKRDSRVRFIDLKAERLWVALPANHRYAHKKSIVLADIAAEPLVSSFHREMGGLARIVTDLYLKRGLVPVPARIVSPKTSMLDLVAANYGIAVIPERMTLVNNMGVTFVPLKDQDANAESALIVRNQTSPLAEAFIKMQIMKVKGSA
ncbi:LysR family transcriptional regulator [Ampullimonas aquatilis]|uniref:LysR family transcriptional regulator n=1 Tax=Ampullimonas aquatilis TaxID=1341549 RepID=UPI003C71DFD0